jgi:hypothetical protein
VASESFDIAAMHFNDTAAAAVRTSEAASHQASTSSAVERRRRPPAMTRPSWRNKAAFAVWKMLTLPQPPVEFQDADARRTIIVDRRHVRRHGCAASVAKLRQRLHIWPSARRTMWWFFRYRSYPGRYARIGDISRGYGRRRKTDAVNNGGVWVRRGIVWLPSQNDCGKPVSAPLRHCRKPISFYRLYKEGGRR